MAREMWVLEENQCDSPMIAGKVYFIWYIGMEGVLSSRYSKYKLYPFTIKNR